ncbi:MAG: glucose-1-phosphate adenylyltransferase [Desulfobacterales bacterium]|nr:MAG: glucose-1-phosphate adenylyltransferase [Desulfobacterales bacterium]
MIHSKDALVLLLAGGVGSRLNILVKKRAKPAVPFAGFYRIIDFSLSNVMISGLTKVGVLTQYKPLSLMEHLGTGEPWDFTGRSRGVKILPPRTGSNADDWYRGTADAVRRNLDFLQGHPAREVVILSGDHIYHMDFDAMIEYHRSKKADVSIAMMVVPKSEIHQFGAGITDKNNRIVDWEEKPEIPRTNFASMGIYVFDYEYLLNILQGNAEDVDFGMHILPHSIERDNVFAYPFYGYWRDVGTIQAYWQANMDVLNPASGISPQKWHTRTNVETKGSIADRPPARFGSNATLRNSLISAGSTVDGTVINSILAPGVVVEKGAVIKDSILFTDCVVREKAVIDLAIMDKRVEVCKGAVIGEGGDKSVVNVHTPTHLYSGISLIGKEATIPEGIQIGRNCVVDTKADASCFSASGLPDGESILFDDE